MGSALFILSLLQFLLAPPPISSSQDGCFFESIYSFGDSLADTGNLLVEGVSGGALASIGRLPYGMSFAGGPTGRSSDGLLMIDFFALGLGLPLLPPYLKKDSDLSAGVNFAVAGATALEKSFLVGSGVKASSATGSSLDAQLDWFGDHISSNKTYFADKLKRSLFFVGEIGGNDYNYALFGGKPIEEVKKAYVPLVVDKIINATERLIDAGAIYLIVPGNLPIGCAPSYLTVFRSSDPSAYDNYKCLKDLNSFSEYHNQRLQSELQKLRDDHPTATIMYADYYNAALTPLVAPNFFGFDVGSLYKSCCGVGGEYNFDFNTICGTIGTTTCLDPTVYVSWDGIHLTQQGYRTMTKLLTLGGFIYPNNQMWKDWICSKKIWE